MFFEKKKNQCIFLEQTTHLRSSKQLDIMGLEINTWLSHRSLKINTDQTEYIMFYS